MLGFGECGAKLPSLQLNIYVVLINAAEICQGGFLFAAFSAQLLLFFHPKSLAERLQRSLQSQVSQD